MFSALLLLVTAAQAADPAYEPLDKAYAALRANDYHTAIASFERAIALAPHRPAIRKDLAYTLLKIGENEAEKLRFSPQSHGARRRRSLRRDHQQQHPSFRAARSLMKC